MANKVTTYRSSEEEKFLSKREKLILLLENKKEQINQMMGDPDSPESVHPFIVLVSDIISSIVKGFKSAIYILQILAMIMSAAFGLLLALAANTFLCMKIASIFVQDQDSKSFVCIALISFASTTFAILFTINEAISLRSKYKKQVEKYQQFLKQKENNNDQLQRDFEFLGEQPNISE